MVTAVLLLKVERGRVNEVAEALADVPGVTEVYSVAGRYDLVAVLRVRETEQMAELVTREVVKVQGIRETETLTAFRAYSRHDLEAAFSLGFQK
ncbi:MAG: Lrp/AsnC ligand binding domain-containing protein [Candidatus Eisenbacteria bacterium]|nr:Lrp/AsnC ligand binding domain-containing protein [Candidatus Eisenbacteria bacterium]